MKRKSISVVGLLTNLRWDWLIFFLFLYWEGGKVKTDFFDDGGRGGKAKSDFRWRGWEGGLSKKWFLMTRVGGRVQTPPKKDDIIYEQSLIPLQILLLYCLIFILTDTWVNSQNMVVNLLCIIKLVGNKLG